METFISNSNVQIERGNAQTTYIEPQSQNINIPLPVGMELCKIGTYQDYIYKLGCN